MKLSVAMCTYNGARYLEVQLQSIAGQTRAPAELIICDDGSHDGSLEIIEAFAAHAPFPVRLVINDDKLGPVQNFGQAINLCSGDVIALCDQDDAWLPQKIERLFAAFATDRAPGLVFSDAEIVDENLHSLDHTLWQGIHFTPQRQEMFRCGKAFEVLLAQNIVTGATMALQARFKELVLPLADSGPWLHDAWIAILIAAVADIDFLAEPLIKYRQHPHQHTRSLGLEGFRRGDATFGRRRQLHYLSHVRQLQALQERLSHRGADFGNHDLPRKMAEVGARIAHVQARLNLPRHKLCRLPCVLRELMLLRYHQYSNGFSSAAGDMMF